MPDDILLQALRREAQPLRHLDDLDGLLALIGDARFVLLGEATHGTQEFYRLRAELTKRLILDKGRSEQVRESCRETLCRLKESGQSD
jgi:erythromycin esterase-like protein